MKDSFAFNGEKAMERIRHFLANEGYRPHGLTRFHHASTCAAADVFDDSNLAIEAFGLDAFQKDVGQQYIQIYGVLQAAYLQQHALMRLYDACGLGRLELPKSMKELREIRNRAAGHPAPPSNGNNTATFLVRFSLNSGHIALHQYAEDGSFVSKVTDLVALLGEHSSEASEILVAIADSLGRAEREERNAILDKGEVAALLPRTWSYFLSKCREAAAELDVPQAHFAKAGIQSLEKMLTDVEAGLRERQLVPIEQWRVAITRAALNRLHNLLDELTSGIDKTLDVAAFTELAERHFRHISEVLHEIDKDLRANA